MGRKSIAGQRRKEILDAYEACVRIYGFHQSSTRKIAEAAGVKQPVIAHYFGSKAALAQALVDKVEAHYLSRLAEVLGTRQGEERLGKALDWLFGPEFLGAATRQLPLGELLAAASRDGALHSKVRQMYSKFLNACGDELQLAFPAASAEACKQVAYGVLSLGVGNDLMVRTGLPLENRNLARQCAEVLVAGLRC